MTINSASDDERPATGGDRRRARGPLLIAAFTFLAWGTLFHGLGAFGLLGPDEPRYAEIAAEMAASRDYVTPRLLGSPWFEKPVFYYWLAAASYHLRGISDAAARFPGALLALGLALALAAFLGKLAGQRAALLALLVALTSAFIIAFARAASTDMPLTAALAASQLSLFLWIDASESGQPLAREWLHLAAALLGLAVLAKGPVAVVLEAVTLAAFALIERRPRWIAKALSPLAVLIFLAVAAPWYIAVARHNPEFLRVFFLEHNLARFATTVYHHPQPFWFYIPVGLLAVFPWTFCLAYSLLEWRDARHHRSAASEAGAGPSALVAAGAAPPEGIVGPMPATARPARLHVYCMIWAAVPVVFFSLSRAKLPGYILPSVPALIALIALSLDARWRRGARQLERWPLLLAAACSAPLPWAVQAAAWGFTTKSRRPPFAAVLHASAPLLAAGLLLLAALLYLVWSRRWLLALLGIAFAVTLAVWRVTGPLAAALDQAASARPLARALQRGCASSMAVRVPRVWLYDPGGLYHCTSARREAADNCCNGYGLFSWTIDRNTEYGLEFYLHHRVPALPAETPAQWPSSGLVVLSDSAGFSRAATGVHARFGVASIVLPPGTWKLYYFNRRVK